MSLRDMKKKKKYGKKTFNRDNNHIPATHSLQRETAHFLWETLLNP